MTLFDRQTRFADALLLLGALGCAAVLALSLSRLPAMLTPAQVALYFVVPFMLTLVFAGALLTSPAFRTNVALTTVSIGLGLVVVEMGLALMPRVVVPEAVAGETGTRFDARSALGVAAALGAAGEPFYPHVSSSAARDLRPVVAGREIVPLAGGLANAMTVFCNETGEWEVYRSDERGFRNPPGLWSSADHDFVLIGDSYAQGSCLGADEGLLDELRNAWPRMLNLGVSAAGPMTELAILREFAADLEPRSVIWLYYEGNDIPDLTDEMEDPILTRYLESGFSQGLVAKQQAVNDLLRARLEEIIASETAGSEAEAPLRHLFWQYGEGEAWWRFPRLNRVQSLALGKVVPLPSRASRIGPIPRILQEALRTVEGWKGQLYFVYLPAYPRYRSWIGEAGTDRQEILDTVEQLGIPMIDIGAAFGELDDPRSMWLHPGGHYNDYGYRFVAKAIVEAVAARAQTAHQ